MTAYVVRERTLPPHIRPDRPIVYDVTETHTTRPVAYGVHTCPDHARKHALHLTQRARIAAQDTEHTEETERAATRARIRARWVPR